MTVEFITRPTYTMFVMEGFNPPHTLETISDALSYRPNGYYYSKKYREGIWDGYIRLLRNDEFPTGLLSRVIAALKAQDIEYTVTPHQAAPEAPELPETIELYSDKLDGNVLTLRDYQYDGVVQALTQKRGIVNAAVNAGKTEVAAGIIKYLLPTLDTSQDEKIIFFTHSTEIATQTHKRLEERLQHEVGFIGKGEWSEKPITVAMIPTLARHLKRPTKKGIRYTKEMSALYRLTNLAAGAITKDAPTNFDALDNIIAMLEDAKSEKQYDAKAIDMAVTLREESATPEDVYTGFKEMRTALKDFEAEKLGAKQTKHDAVLKLLITCRAFIADEAHHTSSTTWYETFMLAENADYRIGLTGTIDKDDDPVSLARFYGSTGDVIHRISNDYLIEKGYSAKPKILLETINRPSTHGALDYQAAYDACIVENEYRNEVIARRVADRVHNEKACLIIVNRTAHGNLLKERLEALGVPVDFIHGSRTTEDRQDALDALADGTLPALIATTILDEGVDVSGINSIWMAGAGKSYKKVIQRVGRGLRKKSDGSGLEVYDFLDYTNPYLTKHTRDRLKYYTEEKFEVEQAEPLI